MYRGYSKWHRGLKRQRREFLETYMSAGNVTQPTEPTIQTKRPAENVVTPA